eukprot:Platyproteum_vivax@DN6379_c0_g1_i1.p1
MDQCHIPYQEETNRDSLHRVRELECENVRLSSSCKVSDQFVESLKREVYYAKARVDTMYEELAAERKKNIALTVQIKEATDNIENFRRWTSSRLQQLCISNNILEEAFRRITVKWTPQEKETLVMASASSIEAKLPGNIVSLRCRSNSPLQHTRNKPVTPRGARPTSAISPTPRRDYNSNNTNASGGAVGLVPLVMARINAQPMGALYSSASSTPVPSRQRATSAGPSVSHFRARPLAVPSDLGHINTNGGVVFDLNVALKRAQHGHGVNATKESFHHRPSNPGIVPMKHPAILSEGGSKSAMQTPIAARYGTKKEEKKKKHPLLKHASSKSANMITPPSSASGELKKERLKSKDDLFGRNKGKGVVPASSSGSLPLKSTKSVKSTDNLVAVARKASQKAHREPDRVTHTPSTSDEGVKSKVETFNYHTLLTPVLKSKK